MSAENGKADLQCRSCLHEWTVDAEYITYPVDDETQGQIVNYASTTCPNCGKESAWDVTVANS